MRISDEGRRSVTVSPSLATTWIEVPAARPRRPPWPGISSTLWTMVPVGIWRSSRQLPGRMSEPGPDWTTVPTPQALGGEDVALGAVRVVEQRDVGGAVGVVLDRRDLRRHAVLEPLEVDLAVAPLGAAAAMARGDAAARVAPAGRVLALRERLVRPLGRDLLALLVGREAASGRVGLVRRIAITQPPPLRRARCGRPERASRSPSSTSGSCPSEGRGASASSGWSGCGR